MVCGLADSVYRDDCLGHVDMTDLLVFTMCCSHHSSSNSYISTAIINAVELEINALYKDFRYIRALIKCAQINSMNNCINIIVGLDMWLCQVSVPGVDRCEALRSVL